MIEKLFDKAPCGYFSFFDDGSFFLANETFYSLTGYTAEELTSQKIETIFTLATRIFCETHLFPMLRLNGQAEEIFLTLLTKEKQHLPVLLSANQLQWEGRTLTTCGFIVVRNRKKFEDELVAARNTAETALKENSGLLKAQAELQHYAEQLDKQVRLVNNQNNELKQFNHVVTHNLKEPLRKIHLYAEKLQTKDLPETLHQDAIKLMKSAAHLSKVIEGLQQYIWLNESSHHFTKVDLGQQVQQAAKQLDSQHPGLASAIQTSALPVIDADAGQVQLLLYHLLQNAFKFKKDEKAHITITATILKRNWFQSMEDKYRYEDFVRLEVRDEGMGFDPAYKKSLFQLFQKLHYGEGLGLGLALCRIIAANHHGFIEADSKLNEFATFTVWLPVNQTAAAR
ncbi:MAG: ATP-binding protein [Chitinophagaceae bacterium]